MTWPEVTREPALLELAHERGGMPALKVALNPPRKHGVPDVVQGVATALKLHPSDIETAWRKSMRDAR